MSVTIAINHSSTPPPGSPTDLSEHLIHLGISAARRALMAPTRIQAERHLRIAESCIDRLQELREIPMSGRRAD